MNFELQSYQMSNLEETVILQTAQNAAENRTQRATRIGVYAKMPTTKKTRWEIFLSIFSH